jgi:hypothetical protein
MKVKSYRYKVNALKEVFKSGGKLLKI